MNKRFVEHKRQDLVKFQDEIAENWKTNDTFRKSVSQREGQPPYVFYEGPPSANGLPGIHHVMARSIKDIFCRFQTLNGKQVNRKAGWDTHGLPIELSVEKELGITKEDIGKKISVDEYNERCKQAVMRYTDVWNDLTDQMGYWVDMEHPYITYENKYIESVWWLLAQLYKKDFLYKGYTIQPYSPKAGTGLSSHELNQPGCYKEVSDTTVVAQFRIPNHKEYTPLQELEGDVFVLAWTTTPWTLPSNTALTLHKNYDYAIVKTFNRYTHEPMHVVLFEGLVKKMFASPYDAKAEMGSYKQDGKKIPYEVVKTVKGEELLEVRYEQLIDAVQPAEDVEKAFRIIHGDHVTTDDGTGIVHTSPTFGADDYDVAKKNGVPALLVRDEHGDLVPTVDKQGRFISEVTPWAGMYVREEFYDEQNKPEKSADVQIAIYLKEKNRAFRVEKYKHTYPHCWRTDKPVLYYPLDSWFVKTTAAKDKLIEKNKTINWKPKSTGSGRFGKWLENLNDWNLSRSRYWGIPLPIWRTEDGKEERIISSVDELKQALDASVVSGLMDQNPLASFDGTDMSEENYNSFDLHKHKVDQYVLTSSQGKPMYRESDLIDVWFDSGSMPYAQLHYPFENKKLIDEKRYYPADFIAEGVDQTRGWFFTLHVIAALVFDSVAYKNVVSNGLVLDKNGVKMSKRLGNAIEPFEAIKRYGSDTIRWYMISNAQPWENLKFDLEGVDEIRRKFFGTLYNTYSFFALYANMDRFDPNTAQHIPIDQRTEMDHWIMSELQVVKQSVYDLLNDYEPTKATRAIQKYVIEDLSNWYVRLNRRRFWKDGVGHEKLSAYWTLFEVLKDLALIISPIAPFYADRLFQDLVGSNTDSVHLQDWPKPEKNWIDQKLNQKNQLIQKMSSLILAIRKKEKIKVRQPLQKVVIPSLGEEGNQYIKSSLDFLKQEVNVKEIEILDANSDFIVKQAKPNFKTLGPKYGKQMKQIQTAVNLLNQEQIKQFVEQGRYTIEIDEQLVSLEAQDLDISTKDIDGWLVNTDGEVTVALDITITEDLRLEGIARDIVNRVQNIRKDNDYNLDDRIKVEMSKNSTIESVLDIHKNYICGEVLADDIVWNENLTENSESIELDFGSVAIQVQKQ